MVVNTWVADTLSGGVTCQSDDNSDYSECYYHANNITGTSANITVTLPPSADTGYMAAYVYEISGGSLIEDVAASQGYPVNPYSMTVDTPASGALAGSADIVFASAAADWPDGNQATLGSGPTNGFTGEDLLNAGGQDPNSIDFLSAYLLPGSSSSTSTEWTVASNEATWASSIIAYEPAGAPTPTRHCDSDRHVCGDLNRDADGNRSCDSDCDGYRDLHCNRDTDRNRDRDSDEHRDRQFDSDGDRNGDDNRNANSDGDIDGNSDRHGNGDKHRHRNCARQHPQPPRLLRRLRRRPQRQPPRRRPLQPRP